MDVAKDGGRGEEVNKIIKIEKIEQVSKEVLFTKPYWLCLWYTHPHPLSAFAAQ